MRELKLEVGRYYSHPKFYGRLFLVGFSKDGLAVIEFRVGGTNYQEVPLHELKPWPETHEVEVTLYRLDGKLYVANGNAIEGMIARKKVAFTEGEGL